MQELIDKSLKFKAMFGFSPELRYLDCRTKKAYLAYEQRLDEALKTGKPGEFQPRRDWPDGLMVD
jgi:hypothetical protein